MNNVIGFIKHLLFRKNTLTSIQFLPGHYFYDPKHCRRYTILSVPDDTYIFYDIHVYDKKEGEGRKHYTFSLEDMRDFVYQGFTPRPEEVLKYSIVEFLESIYTAVSYTGYLDISPFAKVIIRFSDAAKVIQRRWKHYNTEKKRKAVRVIEKYISHYLYKPGGPLAPTCFTS
jgi:hypothetical protein